MAEKRTSWLAAQLEEARASLLPRDLTPEALADWTADKRRKLLNAAPTVIFFITSFWLTVALFGLDHVMPVSCYTALFNSRCRKYNPPRQYARFFGVTLLCLAGARLATSHVLLCMAVNLVMPFLLVFIRSSQLNPRRYFPYMMLFLFLELRPEMLDNMPLQLASLMFSCALLSVALLICARLFHKDSDNVAQLHKNIRRLADDLNYMAEHGIDSRARSELLALKREFSAHAYTAREDSSASDLLINLYDMFAALAHRTAYLTGSTAWHTDGDCPHASYLRELANLTAAADRILNAQDNSILIRRARELLGRAGEIENARFRIFYKSYLHMFLLLLRDAADPTHDRWHLSPVNQIRIAQLRKRPSLDSFELRFTIRCAAVLVISCTTSLAFDVDHLYWFPLTAFLLMQPYPSESLRRMRTRTIGTALGCVVVHGLSMLHLPYAGVMMLGMAFIALLYCSKPGSTIMAFFATVYALSMASLSIGDQYATFMRLACLAAAVVLDFGVDRLVVPTSDRRLFLANMRQLFDLIDGYWEIVRLSLREPMEVAVPCEALLHFQMVHGQAAHYAQGLPDSTPEERGLKDAANHALFCAWELVCELEQLELLVLSEDVSENEKADLDRFAVIAARYSTPFAYSHHMGPAERIVEKFSNEDVRFVLRQYLRRSRALTEARIAGRKLIGEKVTYADEITEHVEANR